MALCTSNCHQMVRFKGKFNVVEKSDSWSALDLLYEWPFLGSLRPGTVSKPFPFKRLKKKTKHSERCAGCTQHICAACISTLGGEEAADLSPSPCQDGFDVVTLSPIQNCMQYLANVTEAWPCTKMVLIDIYNIKFLLSCSIFWCNINCLLF